MQDKHSRYNRNEFFYLSSKVFFITICMCCPMLDIKRQFHSGKTFQLENRWHQRWFKIQIFPNFFPNLSDSNAFRIVDVQFFFQRIIKEHVTWKLSFVVAPCVYYRMYT